MARLSIAAVAALLLFPGINAGPCKPQPVTPTSLPVVSPTSLISGPETTPIVTPTKPVSDADTPVPTPEAPETTPVDTPGPIFTPEPTPVISDPIIIVTPEPTPIIPEPEVTPTPTPSVPDPIVPPPVAGNQVPDHFTFAFTAEEDISTGLSGYSIGSMDYYISIITPMGSGIASLTPEGYVVFTSLTLVQSTNDGTVLLYNTVSGAHANDGTYTPITCHGADPDAQGFFQKLVCVSNIYDTSVVQICPPTAITNDYRVLVIGPELQSGCVATEIEIYGSPP